MHLCQISRKTKTFRQKKTRHFVWSTTIYETFAMWHFYNGVLLTATTIQMKHDKHLSTCHTHTIAYHIGCSLHQPSGCFFFSFFNFVRNLNFLINACLTTANMLNICQINKVGPISICMFIFFSPLTPLFSFSSGC